MTCPTFVHYLSNSDIENVFSNCSNTFAQYLSKICPTLIQHWTKIGHLSKICPNFVWPIINRSTLLLVWHSPGNALYQFYHHVWFSSDSMKPSGHLVVPDNPCNINTKYTLPIYQTYTERREPGMSILKPQRFWGCVQILTSGSSLLKGFTVKVASDCSLSKAKGESECRYPHCTKLGQILDKHLSRFCLLL